ncbi:MAG: hypothetical protein AB9915_03280 [Candidatus Dojkabacteria bacterium]
MCKLKAALFFVIFCLFFISPKEIFAQESSVKGIQTISTYSEDIKDTKDNLLFVSNFCEACTELEKEIKVDSFTVYKIDISNSNNFLKLLKSLHLSCGNTGVEPSVPFFYSEKNCYIGSLAISNRLAVLDLQAKESLASEDFDFLGAYKNKLAVEEYMGKSVADIVLDKSETWELGVLGFVVILAIGFLIYWIVNRKSVRRGDKVLFTVLQIFLFLLPTLYLGIKVNTAVNLGNEYSSAGGCNAFDGSGCVSYAERQAARASNDDYRAQNPETAAKADAYLAANGGTEAAIAAGNAQVIATSQALLEATGATIGDGIDWDKANAVVEALDPETFDKTTVLPVSTTDAATPQKVVEVTGKDGTTYSVEISVAYAINPEAVYVAQVSAVPEIDCSSLGGCETALSVHNSTLLTNYPKDKSIEGNLYQFDKVSGQLIATPINMAVIDDFCKATGIIPPGSSLGSILCRCENGVGGVVFTSAESGDSCDAVCRVRNLVCEDCNPSPPSPPSNPPVSGPYCGDGILGNTTGEQCEYQDPTGVLCSWNSCDSSCKCPTETQPYCGDGKLDTGEQCELGDPNGYQCTWSSCNQVNCKCVEPGCGDGTLDTGEKCERNNPTGVSCLWDSECDQLQCDCKAEQSEYCGDGILQDGEKCELNDPTGVQCVWGYCSKFTCLCPTKPDGTPINPLYPSSPAPQTGLFDSSYETKVILGATLLMIGLLFEPTVKIINRTNLVFVRRKKEGMERKFK